MKKVLISLSFLMFPLVVLASNISTESVLNGAYDTETGALAVDDIINKNIHSGGVYVVTYGITVDSTVSTDVLVTTPNTDDYFCIRPSFRSTGLASVWILENCTYTGGSTLTPVNRDRSSSLTSGVVVTYKPTETALLSGDAVLYFQMLSGEAEAGEFVLDKNTKYLFRLQNDKYGTNFNTIELNWYTR